MKRLTVVASLAAGVLALTACSPAQATPDAGPVVTSATTSTRSATFTGSATGHRISSTVTAAHRASSSTRTQLSSARRQLGGVRIGGRAAKTGYDRTGKFGAAWVDVDGNGCRTRDDILVRDLTGERKRDRCNVVSGTLRDPYTARTLTFRKSNAQAVQIDHMVPLSLAWQLGAQQWSQGKRVTFANDPLNLLAVDGPTNSAKSDSSPDSWLPPSKAYRCTYVMRFTRVVSAYRLRMTISMRDTVTRLLDSCSRVYGTPASMRALPATMWNRAGRLGGGTPPNPTPASPAVPSLPAGPGTAPSTFNTCPAGFPVKGNDGSNGHIYHVPGGAYYDITYPELCFATPAQAEAAGYRASSR